MDLINKSRMKNFKPMATPMNSNEQLHSQDNSGSICFARYRRIIGGLSYLTHARPDLMFVVSVVSRFISSPTIHHFGALKRVLRYVSGTLNYGLLFTANEDFRLIGHSDSNWGGSLVDRRSTTR